VQRREFVFSLAAAMAPAKMNSKERIDRALKGVEVDRTPFSFWYHFGLEKFPAERHAKATLEFHRKFRTDLVKVMSDFPYPKPVAKVEENPFPEQIRALEMIRDSLGGRAYFVETIFNPWNQAEKTSSKEEVQRLKRENPQELLDTLEKIAKSEAAHARRAVETGAAGVFLAIANAGDGVLTRDEYIRFSEPFDRMVLDAVKSAPLNILHLHGKQIHLDRFYEGWPAAAINYSHVTTGVPIADFRKRYGGVIMGGIDEVNYRTLSEADLKQQWHAARQAGGAKFILAPGCSVPDPTSDEEMLRLTTVVGA
jgi:uroporphyrinogen decarboxylase